MVVKNIYILCSKSQVHALPGSSILVTGGDYVKYKLQLQMLYSDSEPTWIPPGDTTD